MSLLLKALQRASKSREDLSSASDESIRGSGRVLNGGLGVAEPPPGGRGRSGQTGRGNAGEDRPDILASASADASLARDEGIAVGEWIRENPVFAFAIAVIVFLVVYFAYVVVAINYPGLLSRNTLFADGKPAVPAAPAPPPAPVAENGTSRIDTPPPPMPALEMPPPLPPGGVSAPVAASAPAATPPLPDEPSPSATQVTAAPLASSEAQVASARQADTQRPARASPRPRLASNPTAPMPTQSSPPGLADPLQVRPTDAGARLGQQIDEAYAALQAGDLGKARTLYGEVLARDGRNLDALLGAGTAAWRTGDIEKASDYYYRVLELDPQSAAAQAALIGLVGRVDPIAAESRLKQLIAREPSGFLYATLGHVYAEQGQWSGAQQAYFQALQSDPGNPDYAYNLAVGLERIGQPKIAVGYYRQALDLASARGSASFDRQVANRRLERLGGAVE